MVQRWKEGVALRWNNPASVQHLIALFVALAICRSASRVSFCMRQRIHRGRCFCLYTGGTRNFSRNTENPELKSTLSHASKRCTPAHCMHVWHTSTKHMPPAGVLFAPLIPLVRVAPAVSPCLYLGLAALFLSLFLLCVLYRGVLAPFFEWAFSRARARTQSLE